MQAQLSTRRTFVLLVATSLLLVIAVADDTALYGPENSSKTKTIKLGVGCPTFQDKFNAAVPSDTAPFLSLALTKGGGYAHVQLHFSTLFLPEGCTVMLRSEEGVDKPNTLLNLTNEYPSGQEYKNKTAPALLAKEFWIDFYRDQVPAQVAAGEAGVPPDDFQCFGFAIDSYLYALVDMSIDIEPATESICAQDNTKEAICYNTGDTRTAFLASMAVARLLTTDSTGNTRACTGWLLGNGGHLITNHHCIQDASEAGTTTAEFMAEALECSNSVSCQTWGACDGTTPSASLTFKYTNPALDYTIVQLVAERADLKQFGYLRLQNAEGTVGQQVYIPQHPLYYGKRISLTDDDDVHVSLVNTSAHDCDADGYSYSGDTQGGSSGSPVIDLQKHSVVGLHFCGKSCANTAIPAAKIVADLIANARSIGGDPKTFDMIDSGQGGNEANFGTYTAPNQTEATLTSQLTFDGGIQVSADSKSVSVDHFEFSLSADGYIAFDVLSFEVPSGGGNFVDLNGDCKATYLDAVIFLFTNGSSSPVLSKDDQQAGTGKDDGTISYKDPYDKTYLKKGSYMLAVAAMGTTAGEALNGLQAVTGTPQIFDCRKPSNYGSYRLQISSSTALTIASTPSSKVTIDPTTCTTPAASICS